VYLPGDGEYTETSQSRIDLYRLYTIICAFGWFLIINYQCTEMNNINMDTKFSKIVLKIRSFGIFMTHRVVGQLFSTRGTHDMSEVACMLSRFISVEHKLSLQGFPYHSCFAFTAMSHCFYNKFLH
jgi:hypothetical protein